MTQSVEQWLAANAHPPTHINLGLAHVQQVCRQLDITLSMPLLTVGGTNGKGSVCHLLAAILGEAGFRVGCYTSPHLLEFGERIKTNGVPAAAADILDALKTVAAAGANLTYFELTTLAAALLFERQQCDIVILEVGLGGRLDAVNVFDADVAVITNIGIDHTEYLGDTRDKIAVEKAGICRAAKPVIVGDSNPPPALIAALEKQQAMPLYIGRDFSYQSHTYWDYHGSHRLVNLPLPALAGEHQRQNAAIALCALENLPPAYWPGTSALRRGLHTVSLPGRAQIIPGTPLTVLDVAHNSAAAAVLEEQLFSMGYYPRTTAVLGMLARKDIGGFVATLKRRIDHWHVAAPAGGDITTDELAAAVSAAGVPVSKHTSIAKAVGAARADSEDSGRIVVTGSFLTVADYLQNTS